MEPTRGFTNKSIKINGCIYIYKTYQKTYIYIYMNIYLPLTFDCDGIDISIHADIDWKQPAGMSTSLTCKASREKHRF